jgi:hypothetical protein
MSSTESGHCLQVEAKTWRVKAAEKLTATIQDKRSIEKQQKEQEGQNKNTLEKVSKTRLQFPAVKEELLIAGRLF